MSHNEDELIKELKELKTNAQLDPEKKDSMKKALQQHAKKKRSRSKAKHTFIWLSTAAALLACSVTVYTLINNNQITLPAGDNEQNEEIGNAGEDAKDPNDMEGLGVEDPDADISGREEEETPEQDDHSGEGVSQQEFKVDQLGEEARTISVEGTEEETTVRNYRMEPYGIEYQVDTYYGEYAIEENTVRHHDKNNYTSIWLYVEKNATIEELANEFDARYNENFDNVSEIMEPNDGENPYSGLTQNAGSQKYYLYQIDENVLVIEYDQSNPEASDGSARLQTVIESIR
ncbi:hypothetical protein [Gracilibacillus thailandensis]|uniref:DUF4367 domain-containing protein n=1 Tax=Gracilibacillus thailandensis TaxID=563735 RepID=A0A6N7R6H5_9BACI|nr:hypothetical protein [Gracilibacillus thailandensis]MRI68718.1 hypothetical protein [Gracilibacillus thailandensis]